MLSSKKKPDIEEQKDGRIILRGRAYHQMRVKLCALAGDRCENPECKRHTSLDQGEAHHENGRGGGKRDDRIYVKAQRNLWWYCKNCHRGTHVPDKVVPAKMSDSEFDKLIGLES